MGGFFVCYNNGAIIVIFIIVFVFLYLLNLIVLNLDSRYLGARMNDEIFKIMNISA